MIAAATAELAQRVTAILARGGLDYGSLQSWGGSRRLAVRVDDVPPRQEDREDWLLGPPVAVAFDEAGQPTKAALGFARKQGIDPAELVQRESERGVYAGFLKKTEGLDVGDWLAAELPAAVASMPFPKTMRWGDGKHRWVRPVHWVVALHGETVLPLELFDIRAGDRSAAHRFATERTVQVKHPDRYVETLEGAHVVVDPARRRERLEAILERLAADEGGRVLDDPALLHEVADLVEWPGAVVGRFEPHYLELPRELLITTLRHHQKAFAVESAEGRLLPAFLAVANTDEDAAGHVRRGNEWVVNGRLEDARFFWNEDRKLALASHSDSLARVVFHARGGSYADKAESMERIAGTLAQALQLGESNVSACRSAARWAKNDLQTGTVGEFPELQGKVGGLLLRSEGADDDVVDAIYAHYQPTGPHDAIPPGDRGCVVAVADKLDSIQRLLQAGEIPKGSRDPYGLRRAGAGIVRILHEREWELSLAALDEIAGSNPELLRFLNERLSAHFRDRGYSVNEVHAVTRPRIVSEETARVTVADIAARLAAIARIRGREDFRNLVKLTQRVDNILTKDAASLQQIVATADSDHVEEQPVALALAALIDELEPKMQGDSASKQYGNVVDHLAAFIEPVEQFFADVLVVDRDNPGATRWRTDLLNRLRMLLTQYFDIRELAGQAEGDS